MIAVTELIEFLGSEVIQVFGIIETISVKHLKPIGDVDENTLDWVGELRVDKQQMAGLTRAKVILCDSSVMFNKVMSDQQKVLIHVKNPKLAFALIADRYFAQKQSVGIDATAHIHLDAVIASTAYIGSHCSIGKCLIGENSKIYPNATIYDGVTIGKNVTIQAGAVIGTDGLGCERKDDGTLVKFPHLGRVVIGDDVEIGANSQIAKGALSNTIIGNGCKINGLCVIAHNCILGKNVWISFNTTLAGSVRIDDNVTIFSKVMVRDQCFIGQGATIGMGTVVTKNIPEGETWLGIPARKVEK